MTDDELIKSLTEDMSTPEGLEKVLSELLMNTATECRMKVKIKHVQRLDKKAKGILN